MDENLDIEVKLKHNLATLANIEKELRKKYDDEEIFNQVDMFKKSLSFYIKQKDFKKAMYESDKIVEFILHYLTD
jgi:hypothetical protein